MDVVFLDRLAEGCKRLATACQRKLVALTELKQLILHKAFTGGLTADPAKVIKEAVQ